MSNATWAAALANNELAATLEMHAKDQGANTPPVAAIAEAAYRLRRVSDLPTDPHMDGQ